MSVRVEDCEHSDRRRSVVGDDVTSLKRAGTYRPWEHPVLVQPPHVIRRSSVQEL